MTAVEVGTASTVWRAGRPVDIRGTLWPLVRGRSAQTQVPHHYFKTKALVASIGAFLKTFVHHASYTTERLSIEAQKETRGNVTTIDTGSMLQNDMLQRSSIEFTEC